MHKPVTKTYFLTDKCENKFPRAFVNSTNKRYIEVHPCYLTNKSCKPDEFEKGAIMCADFVQRDFYQDHMLMYCNQWRTKYKKYEYIGNSDTFRLWFTDKFPEMTIEYHVTRKNITVGTIKPDDYEKAYNRALELFPGDFMDINNVYELLQNKQPPFSIEGSLLNLSRYVDPNSATYTAWDFIDHFAGLNDTQEEKNLRKNGTLVDDSNPAYHVEIQKARYEDPNINRYVVKEFKFWYKNIEGNFNFIAEFLLIY